MELEVEETMAEAVVVQVDAEELDALLAGDVVGEEADAEEADAVVVDVSRAFFVLIKAWTAGLVCPSFFAPGLLATNTWL